MYDATQEHQEHHNDLGHKHIGRIFYLTPCPLESITLSCLLACTIITLLGVGLGGFCIGLGLLVRVRVWVGLSSFNSIRLVHTLWFFHSQYSRFIIHLRFNDFEYAVNLGPEAGVQPILVTVLVLTLAHR